MGVITCGMVTHSHFQMPLYSVKKPPVYSVQCSQSQLSSSASNSFDDFSAERDEYDYFHCRRYKRSRIKSAWRSRGQGLEPRTNLIRRLQTPQMLSSAGLPFIRKDEARDRQEVTRPPTAGLKWTDKRPDFISAFTDINSKYV